MDFIELTAVTLDEDPLTSSLNIEPNFEDASVDMLLPPIGLSPHQMKPPVRLDSNGKFLCSTCARSFSNLANLRNHCRQKHEYSGTYRCKTCDKTFTCKNNFLGHMNKHSKERPYECLTCGKRYMYKQSLNAHVKHCSKAVKASERYYCSYCKLSFKCSKYLKEHNKTLHSDSAMLCRCECGETFKWRSALKKHRDKGCEDRHKEPVLTEEDIIEAFATSLETEDWFDL